MAVGHDGSLGYGRWDAAILTSSDGDNWTKVSSGVFNWLSDIIYANNQFVAVGTYGEVITSPDGVTWMEDGDVGANTHYFPGSWQSLFAFASTSPSSPPCKHLSILRIVHLTQRKS